MKILAIHGSPRKGGNSGVLLEAAISGAVAAAAQVEVVSVHGMNFSPCIHCGGCDANGVCVLVDDMTPIYPKILDADCVLFAAPIYFYGIPGQAKSFVDRCQALWNHHRLLKDACGWKIDPSRRAYYLGVAATQGKKVFDGALLCLRYGFDAMGLAWGGELLVRGPDKKGDMAKLPDELNRAADFGRRIASGATTP